MMCRLRSYGCVEPLPPLKGVNMDTTTKEVLQRYLNTEFHRPATNTYKDDELVPLLLMVLGIKLNTLIELTDKGGSGE